MNRDEIEKLLDGTTPGPWRADGPPYNRIVWSSNENRVCFMSHTNGLDDARDDATSNLVAAAPDLARTCLALMAQLEDAKAAQALVVERAIKEGLRIAAVVPIHQVKQSMDDAIRALADPSGVEALAALRAERDGAVAAEKQRDTELQEQHRIRKAWADRALAAEAQVGALREALDKARDPGRDPDYCYDEEWDYTMRWDEAHDLLDGHDLSEPVEFYTLFKGPRKWAVNVPNSWDEEGIPDGWDTEIFDSEAAARAALASAPGGAK